MAFLVPIFLIAGCGRAMDGSGTMFYVQLVQGSENNLPPIAGATPVGNKLRKRLQCALKGEAYWEIKRVMLNVTSVHPVRRDLGNGQAVEIELRDRDKVALRIYSSGKLVRSREQPIENAFCVSGGCTGSDRPTFIVVRRDRPDSIESN